MAAAGLGIALRRGCRAYVQEPELCTDARPVHRAQHLCRRAGLMQRHRSYAPARSYARAPDLCVGAGIVRGRRTYAPVRRVGRLCVSPASAHKSGARA